MPITKEDCLRHIRDLKSEIESHTKAGEYKTAREKEQKLKTWEERLKMLTKDDDATEKLDLSKENETMIDSCTKDKDDYDETMTTAEARQYWAEEHNSDPILKHYKSFEEWYRESKRNGYIKDDCEEKIFTEGAKDDARLLEANAILAMSGFTSKGTKDAANPAAEANIKYDVNMINRLVSNLSSSNIATVKAAAHDIKAFCDDILKSISRL